MTVAAALFRAGFLLNTLAIKSNGSMPVRGRREFTAHHQPMTDRTRLPWLCDVLPGPHGSRWSVGDVLMLAAFVVLVLR